MVIKFCQMLLIWNPLRITSTAGHNISVLLLQIFLQNIRPAESGLSLPLVIGRLTLSGNVSVSGIRFHLCVAQLLHTSSPHSWNSRTFSTAMLALPHFTPLTPQILLVILQKRQRHLYCVWAGNVFFLLLLPVWQDKGESALQTASVGCAGITIGASLFIFRLCCLWQLS